MIKLTKLNKYYNRGKTNEIHVINNTDLEFPEKGLVALTGPSGCGKTTLLNVIGGLDKFSSGQIQFNEHLIKHYRPLELDTLRNKYIGYIFQNYNLIEDKTVYENIEISLNMAGLHDKDEIEERVNYVLEAVGMYNYRRRNVKALSGGQQQRVAIARAIAKNPQVVLADEPTGNLDANNTFEVMSIIKKISQTCLVILVSHERNLVDFYADTVIELSDGKVVNTYDNVGNRSFEHIDERNIYLKDLNKDEALEANNITRYYDANKDEDLNLTIIEVKDSIYIKADSKKKVKFLGKDSEIRLIDDHYKARKTDDALNYTFNLDNFESIDVSTNRRSFIRWWDTIRDGLKKAVSRRKFISWLFLLAYFVISALVVFQIASFGNLTRLDEKQFLYTSKQLVNVTSEDTLLGSDVDNILNNVDNVTWSPYYGYSYVYISYNDFYQGYAQSATNVFPMMTSWVDENDMIEGNMPENPYEVVIDEWVAESILTRKDYTDLGITEVEQLVGATLTGQGLPIDFTIVGIIQTESPIIVVQEDYYYSFLRNMYMIPYGSMANIITIDAGHGITADNEVLMTSTNPEQEIGDVISILNEEYTIVGTYTLNSDYVNLSNYFDYYFIGSNNAIVEQAKQIVSVDYYWYYGYNNANSGLYFYTDDIDQAIQDITELDSKYIAYDSYESQRTLMLEQQMESVRARVSSIIVTVVGIIIYIFFMMRSSMLSRIKEIGIYRSIGATKTDIFKIFTGEILALTTIGSLSGYLLMSLLINRIENMFNGLIDSFYLPIHYFLGGIIFIYLLNLLFGLLPVINLLRKTPSEINAKYDI